MLPELLQLPEATHRAWPVAAPSSLTAHAPTSAPVVIASLLPQSVCLPFVRTLVITLGPPRASRMNSPSQGPWSHLQTFFPCKATWPQAPGIGMWTSWVNRYSAYRTPVCSRSLFSPPNCLFIFPNHTYF